MELLLNKDKALANLGGDSSLLSTLIAIYHEDAPELMVQLMESVEKQEFDAAKLAAHSLKGILSTFFADSAVNLLAEIEGYCRDRDSANLKSSISKLLPLIEAVSQQLRSVANDIAAA